MTKMKVSFLSIMLIILLAACVDRLYFDLDRPPAYTISVSGFVSDQPGPYRIEITKAFDIESKDSIRVPVSVKNLELSDNFGGKELLSEVRNGVYETKPKGIRGMVGRAYRITIELTDGRIYESVPDTLLPPGHIDDLFFDFKEEKVNTVTRYGYDIMVNSSAAEDGNIRVMWKFTGTFKAITTPEYANPLYTSCNPQPSGKCNFIPVCSGLVNIGVPAQNFIFERQGPCECCICWYNLFNPIPVLSDVRFIGKGKFPQIKVHHLPLDQWILREKIHVKVEQFSLSSQAYAFWQSVLSQKTAVNNLFQPVSGRIKSNFIQTRGAHSPIEGIFYASALSSKSAYIKPIDVPNPNFIPQGISFNDSCLKLFPYATLTKPSFWED